MTNLSILDVEESIQNALESLRSKPPAQIAAALAFLAPEGYHPVVELQEEGRKKRRTASAENWTPETGEILISFTKGPRRHVQKPAYSSEPDVFEPRSIPSPQHDEPIGSRAVKRTTASAHSSTQQEVCGALDEVERQGRSFVALKWFRDEVLPAKFAWAARPEERQAVLAKAIEDGLIVTSRIANPRSPFPTTTIRLNRSRVAFEESTRRFAPIRIQGEPLSSTLLRDRGER